MKSATEIRAPRRPAPVPAAWTSCARCRDLHPVAHLLAFAPLCASCRARAGGCRPGRGPR